MSLRRIIPAITLSFLAVLTVLSIAGAFIGAERAKVMFTSPPMVAYWVALLVLLLAGFVVFPKLVRRPGLLAAHFGTVLIVFGAMAGSQAGHDAGARIFGRAKVPLSYMIIAEGQDSSVLMDANLAERMGDLPFAIRLNRFWIEHYPPEGKNWILQWVAWVPADANTGQPQEVLEGQLPWEVGSDMEVPYTQARVNIVGLDAAANGQPRLKVRLNIEGRSRETVIEPAPGQLMKSLSVTEALGLSAGEQAADEVRLLFREPEGDVRDYKSDLSVLKDGNEVARKVIEVNDPLHYGGYHFYQNAYRIDQEQYTILGVVSDTGLELVYAGFVLLCGGVFYQFWLEPIVAAIRRRRGGHARAA